MDMTASGQVDAVAAGTHAAAGPAGEHGADLDLVDAVGLQQLGVVGKTDLAQTDIATFHGHRPFLVYRPYVGDMHRIRAVGHALQTEISRVVGHGVDLHRFAVLVKQLYGHEVHRLAAVVVQHRAADVTLGVAQDTSCTQRHYCQYRFPLIHIKSDSRSPSKINNRTL